MRRRFLFWALALLLLSCTKQEGGQQSETFDQHPTWTDSNPDAFWDKQTNGGFQIDTAWDGDTTIYF